MMRWVKKTSCSHLFVDHFLKNETKQRTGSMSQKHFSVNLYSFVSHLDLGVGYILIFLFMSDIYLR